MHRMHAANKRDRGINANKNTLFSCRVRARAFSQPVNHQAVEKPRLEMSLYNLYSKETLHMEIKGEALA